jgi:hypothetical protein
MATQASGPQQSGGSPAPATTRKSYEVIGELHMGREPKTGELKVRKAGATVFADELEPEMLTYLLEHGEIADRNAPIPPSKAEGVLAHDHLADVAIQVGALKVSGGEYKFAGEDTVYKGTIEFRKAVSIDTLKKKIVERKNR